MPKRSSFVTLALLWPATLFAQGHTSTSTPERPPLVALGPSVQALASPEVAAIRETLDRYFRGFDEWDAEQISSTLHTDALLTGGVGQPSVDLTPISRILGQLRPMRARTAPPAVSAERTLTDVSLHGGLATALVHMKYRPPTRGAGVPIHHAFQFFKAAGRWTILSVVTHGAQYEGQTDGRTLDAMGIRPGMTIGEIGAGDGRITFALARRVGERGKVYANDIDPKPLAQLRDECQRRGTSNIDTIVGKADDPMFPEATLDLAIMATVYHHLEQPVALLERLIPSLKPGATVVIVDPAYERTGDKDSDRPTTRARVESEAGQAGYELVAVDSSLPRDDIFLLRVKRGAGTLAPTVTTTPWTPPEGGDDRAAILATIDTWWKGHDTDDAVLLQRALASGARTWFEHDGALQSIPYADEISRIQSGGRRPATRPRPGETRTVVAFAQERNVGVVTMLVEIPRAAGRSRSYTTFQLYKADDRWEIVNMAGWNEPAAEPTAPSPFVATCRMGARRNDTARVSGAPRVIGLGRQVCHLLPPEVRSCSDEGIGSGDRGNSYSRSISRAESKENRGRP